MPNGSWVERVWWDDGLGARAARGLLWPLELLYGVAVWTRGALYDAGILPSSATPIPALSVGNVTVGGTGKTPVGAWLAREMVGRGARPAIVLRGYGGDEPLVHRALNPDVPVIAAGNRVAGIIEAARSGCDVAVLDDAFQHRRARRTADLVLVSAESFVGSTRLLPAGPLREPLSALRRASAIAVTRKNAPIETAQRVAERVSQIAPGVETCILHLAADDLRASAGDQRMPLANVRGKRLLAIAAVGNPRAFAAQLEAAGAVVSLARFPDHHRFTANDVASLATLARDADEVVCTLKDAVKLTSLWPREASTLWYVSQRIEVEAGAAVVTRMLSAVLAARRPVSNPDRRHVPA